ncbi:hypothetical protein OH77DRAFT_522363 [Trametes cingulata]|nr:hypothetical protein OH77DRAFT_522363 [Trametes cingulata]
MRFRGGFARRWGDSRCAGDGGELRDLVVHLSVRSRLHDPRLRGMYQVVSQTSMYRFTGAVLQTKARWVQVRWRVVGGPDVAGWRDNIGRGRSPDREEKASKKAARRRGRARKHAVTRWMSGCVPDHGGRHARLGTDHGLVVRSLARVRFSCWLCTRGVQE